ncbi:MAG: acyl-CoA thioesterase, partial [Pseudomonadota bacterium]
MSQLPDIPLQTPLRTETLREQGIPEPWSFGIADKVRFGELDVLAHANNAAYLSWFENFRISYFKDYGFADYTGEFPRLVLRQIGVDFLAELSLNETYIITGRTSSLRTTSFRMDYALFSGGTLRATGWAVLVLLS